MFTNHFKLKEKLDIHKPIQKNDLDLNFDFDIEPPIDINTLINPKIHTNEFYDLYESILMEIASQNKKESQTPNGFDDYDEYQRMLFNNIVNSADFENTIKQKINISQNIQDQKITNFINNCKMVLAFYYDIDNIDKTYHSFLNMHINPITTDIEIKSIINNNQVFLNLSFNGVGYDFYNNTFYYDRQTNTISIQRFQS